MHVWGQSRLQKSPLPPGREDICFRFWKAQNFSFDSKDTVLENQSWLHHNSIPFSQFLSDKACTMLLDTVIFIKQSRGQICWTVSKFQWDLSQRAPCTDQSGVTDKGGIVEPLKSPVSSQHRWSTSCSWGQNLLGSFSYVENSGSFHNGVSGQETPLWRAVLSSISSALREGQPGAQPHAADPGLPCSSPVPRPP